MSVSSVGGMRRGIARQPFKYVPGVGPVEARVQGDAGQVRSFWPEIQSWLSGRTS
ncbi:hypothetical protein [Antarctobacter heliothermus]|uniref:hypothetical protein n=1 Tax=Antarctobacter heliothermus TaxID=74033 RepID=UPI0012FDE23F|nr:hypothetical protein [Antarctobacter heliothermus]